jgi:hypothetical protein
MIRARAKPDRRIRRGAHALRACPDLDPVAQVQPAILGAQGGKAVGAVVVQRQHVGSFWQDVPQDGPGL